MSVATNHIKNCAGASCADNYNWAFLDTLDNLRANNILPVGAGMNQADALQPVVVEVKASALVSSHWGWSSQWHLPGSIRRGLPS